MSVSESHTRVRYDGPLHSAGTHPHPADEMILRRYRIMGSCGTGGFGTVLACWDTRLQRRVAIKRMRLAPEVSPSSQDSMPATQAFASTVSEALSEARTASRLEHPGIVAVHDFAVEDGIAYLVMEYVDGLTLSEFLSRVEGGTLTHDEVAYLVAQLGDAVAFAHRESVLHLDIKPSNIMLTHDGGVKLCDFGMATLSSAAGYADARGGTVGYMPPEQVEGALVDERTDIFALAVVIYQTLTGINPFAAATAEQSCALIKRGVKPRLSKIDPSSAGLVEQTLMNCLSADPAYRSSDVAIVAHDLSYGLGDPNEGAASLAALLSQSGDPEEDDAIWDGERLPLSYRFPWLFEAISRLVGAGICGMIAADLIPFLPSVRTVPTPVGVLAVGIAAALWPPAGSVLILLGFAAVLISAEASALSFCVALVLLVIYGIWWLASRTNQHLSTALLMPVVLLQPAASAQVAAATMKPAFAGITAALGWLLTVVYHTATLTAFTTASILPTLLPLLTISTCIRIAGCTVGAILGSKITHSGPSVARGVCGQLICAGVTIFFQLLAGRLENGGIWPTPTWESAGVAVFLCVFVSFVLGLHGPQGGNEESKEPR